MSLQPTDTDVKLQSFRSAVMTAKQPSSPSALELTSRERREAQRWSTHASIPPPAPTISRPSPVRHQQCDRTSRSRDVAR
eukprot:2260328-Rhodomonas_salina.1